MKINLLFSFAFRAFLGKMALKSKNGRTHTISHLPKGIILNFINSAFLHD